MSHPPVLSKTRPKQGRPTAATLRAALAFAIGIAIACLVGFQLGAVHAAQSEVGVAVATAQGALAPVAERLGSL